MVTVLLSTRLLYATYFLKVRNEFPVLDEQQKQLKLKHFEMPTPPSPIQWIKADFHLGNPMLFWGEGWYPGGEGVVHTVRARYAKIAFKIYVCQPTSFLGSLFFPFPGNRKRRDPGNEVVSQHFCHSLQCSNGKKCKVHSIPSLTKQAFTSILMM